MTESNPNRLNTLYYVMLAFMTLPLLMLFISRQHSNVVQSPQAASAKVSLLSSDSTETEMHLVVLGIAQDAGYPQADCKKSCCKDLWDDRSKRKMVSCLGVRDPATDQAYLFDATPDIKDQLQLLKNADSTQYKLGGIFLTHAHMGHYTGLMQLGREAMGATKIPTYVMPRMKKYLSQNGPWEQLVTLQNIALESLEDGQELEVGGGIKVKPLLVPHRDEYSETVGYFVSGIRNKVLFIPDIDKWSKWDTDILKLIREVDYAFLDGTFFRNGEIWGRDMSQIPHPFISESMDRFEALSKEDKAKVHFIHLNHTNPLLDKESEEYMQFSRSGFKLAEEGQIVRL